MKAPFPLPMGGKCFGEVDLDCCAQAFPSLCWGGMGPHLHWVRASCSLLLFFSHLRGFMLQPLCTFILFDTHHLWKTQNQSKSLVLFLKITMMLTNNLCLALCDGGLVGSCIVLTVQLAAPLGGACPGCTPVPLWRNAALASSGLFGLDATDNCHEWICLPGRAHNKYFYVMVL